MIIEDGKGTGSKARVDTENRFHVRSVSETAEEHQIGDGDGYNLNTGNITFTAAGTMLYVKNNEDEDLSISAIAVGVGEGTTSDIGEITITRNITGGNLISDASAVDQNQNRNFGSNKTLTADVFKGKSGGTSTGGNDIILIYQATNGRVFAPINMVLTKGSTIAITYDPKLSSGSVKAYCALIVYLSDPQAQD